MTNKRKIIFIVLASLIALSSIVIAPYTSFTKVVSADGLDCVEHEVIIVCDDVEKLKLEKDSYEIIGNINENDIVLIQDEDLDTNELINFFSNKDGVLNVEPNCIVDEIEDEKTVQDKLLKESPQDFKVKDATAFQWSMNNDGHMLGKGKGADMNYSAWKKQEVDQSLTEVVVALIDSGVDASNNDIPMWSDPGNIGLMGEYPGADKHGYEEMVSSYEHLERNHGTHCAGIIGSLWNGEGTSGVSSNVKIMSVKHRDSLSSFIKCYQYVLEACKKGVNVRVTSNSWGSGAFHSYILNDLIMELGEKYNVVSVFSAGNSYTDDDTISSNPSVFTGNPYVIIVGSYSPDGSRSDFSSYGQTTVDIFAPGTMILSTDFKDEAIDSDEVTPGYFPEIDNNPVLRQSFDSNSIPLPNSNNITFNNIEGTHITDELSFDGESCLYIPASSLKEKSPEYPQNVLLTSDVVDLSSLEEKPHYLGIKLLPLKNGRLEFSFKSFTFPTTDGKTYKESLFDYYSSSANGWYAAYIDLDEIENIDYKNFYFSVCVNLTDDNYKPVEDYDIYIDMISMGNEAVPYTYMSGTSMSCPAVSGEVAVVCGKYPNIDAKEVVARVLCGTNQNDDISFEGLCTTGEIANVDKALGDELVPYILNITPSNNSLKIDGLFMDGLESVLYRKENDSNFYELPIRSFGHNSIVVEINDDIKGNVDFVLTNTYGKSPIKRVRFENNPNYKYYDNVDIPIPEEVDKLLDTWSGWTAQTYHDSIYFLHQTAEDNDNPEVIPSKIIRYNTKTKTFDIIEFDKEVLELAGIETIVCYAATTHNDKLWFLVQGKPKDSDYADQASFISLDENGNFKLEKKFDGRGPIRDQNFTMVDRDNEMLMVGTTAFHAIMLYDEKNEELITVGPASTRAPNSIYSNQTLWLAGGTLAGIANETLSGVEYYKINNEEDMYESQERFIFEDYVKKNKDQYYGIAAIKEGIIAVGQISEDKTSDTYFIPVSKDGLVGKPTSLHLRAYDGQLYKPACAAIGNDVYVLAAVANHGHVLSMTRISFNPPTPPKPVPYVVPKTCVK